MKTFLIVYTRNDGISEGIIFNDTVNSSGTAAALEQIKEELGDAIVVMNIIELY